MGQGEGQGESQGEGQGVGQGEGQGEGHGPLQNAPQNVPQNAPDGDYMNDNPEGLSHTYSNHQDLLLQVKDTYADFFMIVGVS